MAAAAVLGSPVPRLGLASCSDTSTHSCRSAICRSAAREKRECGLVGAEEALLTTQNHGVGAGGRNTKHAGSDYEIKSDYSAVFVANDFEAGKWYQRREQCTRRVGEKGRAKGRGSTPRYARGRSPQQSRFTDRPFPPDSLFYPSAQVAE